MRPLRADDPRRIGTYALHTRLGSGAMGTVYLSVSPGGRAVAVKVARPELADDPEFRERFRREVEMARAVGGFWTAAVVDADAEAAQPWLATEYVPAPNLQQAVSAHGPLPERAVRRLAAGLAEALGAIHAAGLVHRDLKPSNILLGLDGPRVIDFGISQAVERAKLTATGVFLGTPGFLSPEQITGADVGPPSDVFAVGANVVYAATGQGPFGDAETSVLMYRATHDEPRLDGVPPSLRSIVADCLLRDPARRPTPATLLARLRTETADTEPQESPDEGTRPDGEANDVLAPDAGWLPTPVRILVEQYHADVRQRTAVSGSVTVVAPTVATDSPRPTRMYTVLPTGPAADGGPAGHLPTAEPTATAAVGMPPVEMPPVGVQPVDMPTGTPPLAASPPQEFPPPTFPPPTLPAAPTGPGQPMPLPPRGSLMPTNVTAGAAPPAGSSVRFATSRLRALGWAGLSGFAALVVLAFADRAGREGNGAIALALLVVVAMCVTASVRSLRGAMRRRTVLDIGPAGIAVSRGRDSWQLPWHAIARTRVVDARDRPWLVVWLTPGWQLPRTLGGSPLPTYHGGIRLYPVAHERRRARRAREVRELRAALAWHAPWCYDGSP